MNTTTALMTTAAAAAAASSCEAEANDVRAHMMCITKKGFYNKKADALISKMVSPLFMEAFGCGATKASIRRLNIKHALVLCIDEAGEGAAAAALVEPKSGGVVKLHGVCVRRDLRARGYGTRFMQAIPQLLPAEANTTTIELCIDCGRPDTARLLAWYARLGYHVVGGSLDGSEVRLQKRLGGGAAHGNASSSMSSTSSLSSSSSPRSASSDAAADASAAEAEAEAFAAEAEAEAEAS